MLQETGHCGSRLLPYCLGFARAMSRDNFENYSRGLAKFETVYSAMEVGLNYDNAQNCTILVGDNRLGGVVIDNEFQDTLTVPEPVRSAAEHLEQACH